MKSTPNFLPLAHSNTTLVKVKFSIVNSYTSHQFIQIQLLLKLNKNVSRMSFTHDNSNTTLVKVKCIKNVPKKNKKLYSNTTLVKVK